MKTTIKEYGYRLPIGIINHDKLEKNFEGYPWTLKREKELAQSNNIRGAGAITEIVTALTKSIGHYDFETMKFKEKRAVIERLFLADILYMFLRYRIDGISQYAEFQISCPACGTSFPFMADLETTPVEPIEKIKDIYHTIELRNGIQIGQKLRKRFVVQPLPWRAFLKTKPGIYSYSIASIEHSIVKEADENIPVTPGMLQDMTKRDMLLVQDVVSNKLSALDLSIEAKCMECQESFPAAIDWRNFDFL